MRWSRLEAVDFSLLRHVEATTGQDEQVFGITTVRVVGPSMEPTLRNGEVYLVRQGGAIQVGDVVLLQHPLRNELLTIKRVVRREPSGWWVEGDNREASTDSREFGPVSDERVRGKITFRISPLRRN